MIPLLDCSSIEDKTVQSCEPSSLIAANSAIKTLSYKFRQDRIIIQSITVEASGYSEDTKYPGNYSREFTIKIGFHIKKVWHFAEIVMEYNYAPKSVMGANDKSIKISKQIGTGKDAHLVEIFNKSNNKTSYMVSILKKEE